MHTLSITSLIKTLPGELELRGPLSVVTADTSLGPFPQFHPEVFEGTLVGVSTEQLLRFRFDSRVVVMMEGVGYIFRKLEADGTFTLIKRTVAAVLEMPLAQTTETAT